MLHYKKLLFREEQREKAGRGEYVSRIVTGREGLLWAECADEWGPALPCVPGLLPWWHMLSGRVCILWETGAVSRAAAHAWVYVCCLLRTVLTVIVTMSCVREVSIHVDQRLLGDEGLRIRTWFLSHAWWQIARFDSCSRKATLATVQAEVVRGEQWRTCLMFYAGGQEASWPTSQPCPCHFPGAPWCCHVPWFLCSEVPSETRVIRVDLGGCPGYLCSWGLITLSLFWPTVLQGSLLASHTAAISVILWTEHTARIMPEDGVGRRAEGPLYRSARTWTISWAAPLCWHHARMSPPIQEGLSKSIPAPTSLPHDLGPSCLWKGLFGIFFHLTHLWLSLSVFFKD